jgi:DTW domain-containing protein YfiP
VRHTSLAPRCARCAMKPVLCLCQVLHPRAGRHAVRVVVHETELDKSTNSGRLLPLLWEPAALVPYGNDAPSLPEVFWPVKSRPLVLFPLRGGKTIDQVVDDDPRPFTLIVLDGTWHQANRLRKRFHRAGIPFVGLPERASPALYRLRRGHFGASMSTLEATAAALAILERDSLVEDHLLDGFRRMQDRTLWLRGSLATQDVYGGIPEGIKRHEVNVVHDDDQSTTAPQVEVTANGSPVGPRAVLRTRRTPVAPR